MEIEVRKIQQQDRAAWEELYHQYAEFYQVPMDQGILDAVWSWIHDKSEQFYCLVAVANGDQVIGFMHFRAMRSPLRGTNVGFLDDLYIVPRWRGVGVVDSLFKALDEAAQTFNWPFVRWITADDNLRAQAVYSRLSEKTKWITYQLNTAK